MTRAPISKALRFEILARDGFRCVYCGREAGSVELHIDHVKAHVRGGPDVGENLVSACVDCNLGKSDRDLVARADGYALVTRRRKRIKLRPKVQRVATPAFKAKAAPAKPKVDPYYHMLNCQLIDSLDEIDDDHQLALVWCISHWKYEWHNLPRRLIGGDEVIDRRTKPGWTGRV